MSPYRPIPNPRPLIATERKPPQFYKGLRVKTDSHLHEQLVGFIRHLRAARPDRAAMPVPGSAAVSAASGAGETPALPANGIATPYRVLDWGSGDGALAQRLHDEGCAVTAVDVDAPSFRAQGPEFERLDFNRPDEVTAFVERHRGRFDLILSVEVIEHVHNPWEFIGTLHRLCGPETDVVITTPNISHWWGRFWFLLTGDHWGFTPEGWVDPGHINAVTRTELLGILRDTGFDVRQVWVGGRLPVVWAYNWKRLLISLAMLPLRPLMRGDRDGFVLCVHARRREEPPP